MNDLRVLRGRHGTASSDLDRSTDPDQSGTAAVMAVTVLVHTYPTSAAVFYGAHPVTLTGPVTEGASPVISTDATVTFFALNVGTAIPPAGTLFVGHAVGGRWVFRYDG
jgi:hypothetical protein